MPDDEKQPATEETVEMSAGFGFEQSQTAELQSWEIPLDDELDYRSRRRRTGIVIGFLAVFFGIVLWSLWGCLIYRFLVLGIPVAQNTENGIEFNTVSRILLGLVQICSIFVASLSVIAWIDLRNNSTDASDRLPIWIALAMFAVSLPPQLYYAGLDDPLFLWHIFVIFWRTQISF